MLVEMIDDDFVEQAIHGAAHGGDEMPNLRATRVPIEPSLDGRNLAGGPLDAGQEVALLFDHMSRRRAPVPVCVHGPSRYRSKHPPRMRMRRGPGPLRNKHSQKSSVHTTHHAAQKT